MALSKFKDGRDQGGSKEQVKEAVKSSVFGG